MDTKERNNHETGLEVAVIGMAGRFPGANNIAEFWNNLKNGVESISFFTDEELLEAGIEADLVNNPNYVKAKGVLEDMEYFDSSFFDYSPREAELMDPQFRILHECAWHTLEDAGYNPDSYTGAIGLYVGTLSNYQWVSGLLNRVNNHSEQIGIGSLNDRDFLSTRVAYKLNLKGPAVNVQTACSTSLVAIYLACQGLLGGDSDMALAGGVSIWLPKKSGYLYEKGMVRSPDGRCRAFDGEAKGTNGGDGVALVLLKRLEDARADGDNIYAVVKGSAINNDGNRKVGYTAPSVKAEAEVIKAALQMAEVEPESITYVEAHGTGTPLGDPVEVEALRRAFGTEKLQFCGIGSVKTNVGHMDAVAGAAGFVKTVLALKHRLIPPSLHFKTPNPGIDFENSPFYVNTTAKEWKNNGYPLRAGVSSFGIGGTNAHAVLEEAPKTGDRRQTTDDRGQKTGEREYQLILLSAKTDSALDRMTKNLADHFKNNPGIHLADAAYTLQVGRKAFEHRKMVVCSDVDNAIDALSSSTESGKHQTFHTKEEKKSIIFMFSGLGSQYVNMGYELYKTEPLFRQEMDRCFEIVIPLMDDNLKEILYPSSVSSVSSVAKNEKINQIEISQPVIFILEYALARLLMKWGITPDAMIGYSFGEYAVACISGVFSLEDALKMVVLRGQLIQKLPAGIMLSVPLPAEELKPLLNDELSLAIDNGPSCIAAGPVPAVETLEKKLKNKKYLCMRVSTSHAIHSKMMEPILREFEDYLTRIKLNKPQIPYISNVTGKWTTLEQAANPHYWLEHLKETVQFGDGIKELVKTENSIFVEIGPGRDLTTLVMRYIDDNPGQQAINLIRPPRKNISDVSFLFNRIGRLWLWGVKIEWNQFQSQEKIYRMPLPTYPFERQQYWIECDTIETSAKVVKENTLITKKTDIADWFYIPSWKRSILRRDDKSEMPGKHRWLIFLDQCGIASMFVERLKEKTQEVITVVNGLEFKKSGERVFSINPSRDNDYNMLFNELSSLNIVPDKIVHFWGVTEEVPRGPAEMCSDQEFAWFDQAQDPGFYSLLYLAKAIAKKDHKGTVEIIVVTNNMQHVAKEDVLCPEKATVLGPVKVIPQEQPGIVCRSIDVVLSGLSSPERKKKKIIGQLWTECQLSSKSLDTVVALRDNHRWVQTFEPVRLEEVHEDLLPLRKKGVYLMTGGLGDTGLMLARYLAEYFGARLILTGRSEFPAKDRWDQWLADHEENDTISQKITKLKKLEQLGARVLAFQADAADREQMQQVIRQAESNFETINGVIHAAGITRGKSFTLAQKLNKTECQQQFLPKVYGLLILEDLLTGYELDFFWVISSLAVFLGGSGFAAYAAANNFMDAYVNLRNQVNYPSWMSVNWEGMDLHKTIEGFKRTLSIGDSDQVVVSSGGSHQDRVDRWIKTKLGSLRDEEDSKKQDSSPLTLKPRPDLMNPYTPPGNPLEETLAGIWTDLFGFEKIGIHDDFFELEGDSLKAITMAGKIHKEIHIEIPLPEFFTRHTIKLLAEYIEGNSETGRFSSIEPAEKKEYYDLSSAHKRVYILEQRSSINTAYNMPTAVKIDGPLNIATFEKTILSLIRRHESLRTSFKIYRGELVQRIYKFDNLEFEIEYYRSLEQGIDVDTIIQDFIRPFDLSWAPLLRVGLIKLSQQEHILLFDIHHIISDGVSRNILEREFVNFYAGKELPELRINYKEFSEWEKRFFETPVFKQQQEFWRETLKGERLPLQMPLDFNRPEKQTFAGRRIAFTIPGEVTKKLNILAKKKNVTLNILVLSIYILLLYKYSDQEDIIVGSLVSGRNHVDLENIIGMFGNFLPIKTDIDPSLTFSEFLNSAGKTILDAYENQAYPFEEIIEMLNLPVDLSRNPLFDTMLVFHNEAIPTIHQEIDDLKISSYQLATRTSTLDFKIDVFLGEMEEFNCSVEYNTGLFKEETIKYLIRHFQLLIAEVIERPDRDVSDIEIFTKEEKLKLSQKRKHNTPLKNKPVRLVISATFTSEPIEDYIKWWGKQFGLDIDVVFAPYNQVFQELLDEESLTSTNGDEGINLLLIRFEDWIRDLYLSDEKICEKLESNFKNLKKIFKNKQKTVPYFVGIFSNSTHLSFSSIVMNYLEDMYGQWKKFLEKRENVYIVDFTQIKELYSVDEGFDPLTDREGHLPFSSEFYAAMGTTSARKICAFANNPFKVIVLDCDNTLWKGICGEDGPLGVSVDTPYLELQRFMVAKYHDGFLLALCSKNNEADVWEVFEKNPGMLLKKEHFAGWKINWLPKSENIKALAQELNLGIDSFIFLDDSPMECSEVMTNCPEVLTLQLPENPGSIPLFLNHVWAFDKIKVTDEDRHRTQMYRAEKKRKESEKESVSLNDFLADLHLKISMNVMNPSQVSRVSQLTLRTNQFNLSTIRRNEDKIMNLGKEPDTQCWVIEVSDRFGDYGLVGVIITKEEKESLFIDTLLLSCRVLGRKVEEAILAGLRKYSESRQLKYLEANYFPTPKNKPLLAFLQNKWIQQQDQGEYITYIYLFENRSESIEFVDFYYQKYFNRNLPREMKTVEEKKILSDHTAPALIDTDMERVLPQSPLSGSYWVINTDKNNTDKLQHKKQLLPLENYTAKMLVALPTYKIDKKIAPRAKYEPPRNKWESRLVKIWQKILRMEKVGVNETFFELGGNSLKAMALISDMHKAFDVELSLKNIFEKKTVKELAGLISCSEENLYSSIEVAEEKEYYPLSSAQKRLYILQQMELKSTVYNVANAVVLEGNCDKRRLEYTFRKLIKRHDSLRTSFEMLEDKPVQKIHEYDELEFSIEYYD